MPEATKELIERGRQLYLSETIKCHSCHGQDGKGTGPSGVGLKDDWGNPVTPRDFTQGIFRGGFKPADLYKRVACGVKGTPMPAFAGILKPDEIWAVVHFVRMLNQP